MSLFVYPKNGQSDQQTANDRYQCHQWAVGQTGYDPTNSANTSRRPRQRLIATSAPSRLASTRAATASNNRKESSSQPAQDAPARDVIA